MADNNQTTRKVKCPHCGSISSVPVGAIADSGTTVVVRGVRDTITEVAKKVKSILDDNSIDATNAWIDMPKCSHCGNI